MHSWIDWAEKLLPEETKENIQSEYLLMELYEYALEINNVKLLQQLSNIDGNIQYGGQPIIQLMTIMQYL